jgi:hypothetical protein
MHLECVSVLLFGAGTGQTGVYSLQQWTEEEDGADGGLPHDTVLAFESPSDAEQYAKLLERQMGRRAQVRCGAAAGSSITTLPRPALSTGWRALCPHAQPGYPTPLGRRQLPQGSSTY